MKRALLGTWVGVIWGLAIATVHADEWRPVERAASSAQSKLPQLGKPITPRTAMSAPAADSTSVVQASTSNLSPLAGLQLQPTALVVRGQGPDGTPVRPVHGFGGPGTTSSAPPPMGIPGSPEEQYNCGVVSEGPPAGGSFLSAPSSWLSGVSGFFGSYTNFVSDHAFDNFISPVSNPFYFEDPRSLTELRPIFMWQRSPGDDPLFKNADTFFFGLQARLALTDRWSLTLNKLGFIALNSDGTAGSDQGLSELNFGIKYTFWRDDCTNTLMALGLQAEIPIGSSGVFQDTGSTSLTPYISAAQQLGQNWHVMGTFGYRFALDNERSEMFFLSGHLDYSIFNRIYPLVEMTWWHYTSNGSVLPGSNEGADLFNLGRTGASGDNIVTLAAGVRFKITEAAQMGVVFEIPIVGRDELMDFRITADFILRY